MKYCSGAGVSDGILYCNEYVVVRWMLRLERRVVFSFGGVSGLADQFVASRAAFLQQSTAVFISHPRHPKSQQVPAG